MMKYLQNCQFKCTSEAKFGTDNEIHIWKIPAIDYAGHLPGDLSDDENEKLAWFKNQQAKKVYFSSRQAMRILFSSYLGCPANQLEFAVEKQGKPYLFSHHRSLEFNLSHSGEEILLAVSANTAVGIDVEAQRKLQNWEAIARKVFDQPTIARLTGSRQPASNFITFWTVFEAKKKLSGQGVFGHAHLHDAIETILFEPKAGYQAALAFNKQDSSTKLNFYLFDYRLFT